MPIRFKVNVSGSARSLRFIRLAAISLLVASAGAPAPAQADIYSYIDKRGVVHFTNIPRPEKKWRRLMRTGPGKAQVIHAPRRSQSLSAGRYTLYDQHIREASALYHIPEELIRAVVHVESDYDPRAISRVGARGLMQLMPGTASDMGVKQSFDPRQNIFGGTRYLRVLANRFRGDLVLTLASYHAGPAAVAEFDGVPPYRTTHYYVRQVLKRYRTYRTKGRKLAREGGG